MTIRMGSPDFLRMFPTVVWTLQLDEEATRAINPAILRRLADIRASAGELSAGESWQSGHALHRLDEFRDLVEGIQATTRKVLSFLKIVSDGFEITGCWANVNGIGASHGVHNHPNNFLSGVYYVQTQAGADSINFHDPRVQTAIIRPPVTALTADNTDQVVVRVRDGTLLLFPAWLPHSVDPNRSARERVSISFNIMFSACAVTLSPPLWGRE
jgi:uncharacterized protein (TIGR02466 family)